MNAIDKMMGYLLWTFVVAVTIIFVGVWCGKTLGAVTHLPPTQAVSHPVIEHDCDEVSQRSKNPMIEKQSYVSIMHTSSTANDTGIIAIPAIQRGLVDSPVTYRPSHVPTTYRVGVVGGLGMGGTVFPTYQPVQHYQATQHYQSPMMHQPMYQPLMRYQSMGFGGYGMGGVRCGPSGCR